MWTLGSASIDCGRMSLVFHGESSKRLIGWSCLQTDLGGILAVIPFWTFGRVPILVLFGTSLRSDGPGSGPQSKPVFGQRVMVRAEP